MDYFYKDKAFSDELLNHIMDACLKETFSEKDYSKHFGRFQKNIYFSEEIEKQIEEESNKHFKTEGLKLVYNSLNKYQIKGEGFPSLVMHKDNLPCSHVIDLTVDTTLPEWGLICEEDFYNDVPGAAVFFEGKKVNHGRPKYPSISEKDYTTLLFISLAHPGHWGLVAKEKLGDISKVKFFQGINDSNKS
jgi:hypothetical protein